MTYTSEVLADSPLVYLHFDESAGTTAVDSSGNGRDMTSANCTVNQATVMPSGSASYDFNGTSSQVSLADAVWQRPATFTVEAWVRMDSTSGFRAVAAKDASGAGWAFYIIDGKLSLYTNGVAHTDAPRLVINTTYHVAATYSAGTIKLYLNGAEVYSVAGASLTHTTGTALLVGASTGSNGGAFRFFWYDGRLDEVAYYGTALSGSRIAAHYAAATAPPAITGTMSVELPLLVPSFMGTTDVTVGTLDVTLPKLVPSFVGVYDGSNPTDSSNVLDGRERLGSGTATITRPVVAPPAGMALAPAVDKALAYPAPTMVNGRPT